MKNPKHSQAVIQIVKSHSAVALYMDTVEMLLHQELSVVFLLYSHQKTQYSAVMVSILNHYYYTGPSNDIIAKDDSINPSRTAKQIR